MCSRMCMCARLGCAERLITIARCALSSPACSVGQRIDAKRIMMMSGPVNADKQKLEVIRTPIRETDELTELAEAFGVIRDRRPGSYTVQVVVRRGQR